MRFFVYKNDVSIYTKSIVYLLEKAEKHPILCESLKKNTTFAEYRALFRKKSLNLQVEIKGNSMGQIIVGTFKAVTETRSSIIPTMITTFGMKDGLYSDQIIAKIDLDTLF